MFQKFPFGSDKASNGPGIMESLKAIGEVADLLQEIRDELHSLNTNLSRFVPREVTGDRQETGSTNGTA